MEQIQAEVRLYFLGRQDWDTEFFKAISNTDIMVQATDIAQRHRADHYNFGLATPEEEYKHSGPSRRPAPKGLGASARVQVDAIKGFLGVETEERQ